MATRKKTTSRRGARTKGKAGATGRKKLSRTTGRGTTFRRTGRPAPQKGLEFPSRAPIDAEEIGEATPRELPAEEGKVGLGPSPAPAEGPHDIEEIEENEDERP